MIWQLNTPCQMKISAAVAAVVGRLTNNSRSYAHAVGRATNSGRQVTSKNYCSLA
jgi:hypothetical protein